MLSQQCNPISLLPVQIPVPVKQWNGITLRVCRECVCSFNLLCQFNVDSVNPGLACIVLCHAIVLFSIYEQIKRKVEAYIAYRNQVGVHHCAISSKVDHLAVTRQHQRTCFSHIIPTSRYLPFMHIPHPSQPYHCRLQGHS